MCFAYCRRSILLSSRQVQLFNHECSEFKSGSDQMMEMLGADLTMWIRMGRS